MAVVSNTTPISELAKVGRLVLLHQVFVRIIIPEEVYAELAAADPALFQAVQAADWIEVRTVRDRQRLMELLAATGLGLGECAAITLALELGSERIVIDDQQARREAQGLPLIGTVGTILLARRRGLIQSVKHLLDDLVAHGTYIGDQLYRDALAAGGGVGRSAVGAK